MIGKLVMLFLIVVSWIPLIVILLVGAGGKSIIALFGIGVLFTLIFGTILLAEYEREKKRT